MAPNVKYRYDSAKLRIFGKIKETDARNVMLAARSPMLFLNCMHISASWQDYDGEKINNLMGEKKNVQA